jgi:DNA-binding response OmpR family regulator
MGGNMSEKKRVLVVEDETPLAMMIVFLLNRVGYAVTVASSGQQAIDLAARRPFDLITLDLNLPDIRGFEICSRLKNQSLSQNTPIVFVTGQREEENRQRAFELGAVDYIEKPFEMSDFVFRISRCLANFLPGQVMAHHH